MKNLADINMKNNIIMIIIVVIIIIILLFISIFIHKKDDKSPFVNKNIIEIVCDNESCLSKKKENPKTSNSKVSWHDFSELKLFENSVYQFESEIAPESRNAYRFILKNSTKYKFIYKITFNETNPYNINMQYKLKKNDEYIVSEYAVYDDLNLSGQLIEANGNDLFDLEWKWISSNHDNNIEKSQENYHLKMKIEAEGISY